MEVLLGLFGMVMALGGMMLFYFYLFRLYDQFRAGIRGEHKVKTTPALLEKYHSGSSGKLMEMEGSFLDLRQKEVPAVLPEKYTHALVLGRSGSGKSTLVESIARSYIEKGDSAVVVIEPHLSLCQSLAKWGTRCQREVTFLDLALSTGMVTSWNPLESDGNLSIEDTVGFFLGCLDEKFGIFQTPRQGETLKAGLTLLAESRLTLNQFSRIFQDGMFRGKLLENSQFPFCKEFFQKFDSMSKSNRESMLLPALNKISLLTQDKTCRLILCQKSGNISISNLINHPGVFLVCLNRGANPVVSDIMGSLLFSALKNAIFQRPPNSKKLPGIHIFCDEFPSFISPDTGSSLLAESRKYGVSLTFISQFLQISHQRFKRELVQNTSLHFLFSLEGEEAHYFGPKLGQGGAEKLVKLPPFHGYLIDKQVQEVAAFVTRPIPKAGRIQAVFSHAMPMEKAKKNIDQGEFEIPEKGNESARSSASGMIDESKDMGKPKTTSKADAPPETKEKEIAISQKDTIQSPADSQDEGTSESIKKSDTENLWQKFKQRKGR